LLVLRRGRLVACARRAVRVRFRLEAPYLRVAQAARRLERVDAHVLREATRLGAGVDALVDDIAGRQRDARRKPRLARRLLNLGGRHVGSADDVLLAEREAAPPPAWLTSSVSSFVCTRMCWK